MALLSTALSGATTMQPRSRPPLRIEAQHAAQVRAYVTELERVAMPMLRAALPDIYPQPAKGGATADDLSILDRVLGVLRVTWLTEIATEERIAEDCEQIGRQLDLFSARYARTVLRSIAVPGWEPGGKVEKLMPFWIQEHTDLISRGGTWRGKPIVPLGEQVIEQIGEVVREGFAVGERHEVIAKQIRKRFDVGRSRATLIGRDQTNKLNGALMQEEFRSAGQHVYVWRTSRDERVRPTHAAMEGVVVAWDSPPPMGHVGQDYQCRCTAAPLRRLGEPL